MRPVNGKIGLIDCDFSLLRHREAFLSLIEAYLGDVMGEGRSFDQGLKTRLLEGLSRSPGAFTILACHKEKIVGMAVCFVTFSTFNARKVINVHDLIVLSPYRRKGIAQTVLREVERRARAMDCCKVTLEVRADNRAAMALYRREGFSAGDFPMYFWRKMF